MTTKMMYFSGNFLDRNDKACPWLVRGDLGNIQLDGEEKTSIAVYERVSQVHVVGPKLQKSTFEEGFGCQTIGHCESMTVRSDRPSDFYAPGAWHRVKVDYYEQRFYATDGFGKAVTVEPTELFLCSDGLVYGRLPKAEPSND